MEYKANASETAGICVTVKLALSCSGYNVARDSLDGVSDSFFASILALTDDCSNSGIFRFILVIFAR